MIAKNINITSRGRVVYIISLKHTFCNLVTDEAGNELPVGPGNTYIGARQTVDIYVAERVDEENGWVLPQCSGYSFDTWECVRVEEVDESVEPVVFAI